MWNRERIASVKRDEKERRGRECMKWLTQSAPVWGGAMRVMTVNVHFIEFHDWKTALKSTRDEEGRLRVGLYGAHQFKI